MRIAVLGYGDRGSMYAEFFQENGCTIEAVCDVEKMKTDRAIKNLGIAPERCYNNEEAFWKQGKIADLLVVSTLDQLHYRQTIRAMNLGYDILLEKPIASTLEECQEIESLAQKTNSKIYLCYVLRYAPFFLKIKELIDSGIIGKVMTINLTECVAYWHQAHSFVRGNWRNATESSPMIVAKCCHDTDILYWLVDSKPIAVSSMGELSFFNEKNAPKGASKYCFNCPYAETCAYNNYKFYSVYPKWISKVGYYDGDLTDMEAIKECLADTSNPYSRCVFYCDNDVVDHQVTNIVFENGATAHLTMTAFSEECTRKIRVHGTYGEIYGDLEQNTVCLNVFGKEHQEFSLNEMGGISGHGGGDPLMVANIVEAYRQNKLVDKNGIKGAMYSHYIAFAAEESRRRKGELQTVFTNDFNQ